MLKLFSTGTKLVQMVILTLSVSNVAFAKFNASVLDQLKNIESQTEGRLGVFAMNTENGQVIKYRDEEIFPTMCTSKVMAVAAVLNKSMSTPDLLAQKITYSRKDLDYGRWNPVTEKFVSEGMTVEELGSAAISFSDNTAMNLLLKTIGGIQGINDFARSINDPSFRQDQDWPAEAYSGGKGNIHDSSTPKAMIESLKKILLSTTLDKLQRDLITKWMINTQTGAARIRSGVPDGWLVGNKTGTGGAYGSTNDIAIIWPPKHAPILIGVFYTSDLKEASTREDILSDTTKTLIKEFIAKDKNLLVK